MVMPQTIYRLEMNKDEMVAFTKLVRMFDLTPYDESLLRFMCSKVIQELESIESLQQKKAAKKKGM
jgi:hypothetical protein